jgi:uncharacterized membrane protein YfcA
LGIGDYLLLFAFGCAGGLLAGLLGIGGGIIYIFVLRHTLAKYNLPDSELVKFILSNSIAATFFAGLAGSIKQIKSKNYYPREIAVTGSAGVISALAVTAGIVHSHWYSQDKFMLVFMALLLFMAVNMYLKRNANTESTSVPAEGWNLLKQKYPYFLLAGLLTGAISSLSGLGGGVILIPILANFIGMDVRKAASISLGIIPLHALAMGIYYSAAQPYSGPQLPWSFGYIVLPILLPILAGVVIFTPIGVRLSQTMPQKKIKIIFSIVILTIFLRTTYAYFFEI